ncbi:MAG: hypothetical protein J3Q66DRAFT_406393 [Benniella sp.]|nr:MAG: hypothetical protein J3Q66DRAFT_406393 [Benniella sp.]
MWMRGDSVGYATRSPLIAELQLSSSPAARPPNSGFLTTVDMNGVCCSSLSGSQLRSWLVKREQFTTHKAASFSCGEMDQILGDSTVLDAVLNEKGLVELENLPTISEDQGSAQEIFGPQAGALEVVAAQFHTSLSKDSVVNGNTFAGKGYRFGMGNSENTSNVDGLFQTTFQSSDPLTVEQVTAMIWRESSRIGDDIEGDNDVKTEVQSKKQRSNGSSTSQSSIKTMRCEYQKNFDTFGGDAWTLTSGVIVDEVICVFTLTLAVKMSQ